jgi:hypothetical protein
LSQDRLSKLADVSYNSIIKLETGGITNENAVEKEKSRQKEFFSSDIQVRNGLTDLLTTANEKGWIFWKKTFPRYLLE